MELDSGRAEMTGLLWPIENQSRSDLRSSSIAIAGPRIGKASRNHWNLVQTALSDCSLGMEADHLELGGSE